jgi:hypothetical protein
MTRNGTPSTVDICKTMPTLAAGDHFYILADVVNSGWIKYRYFVYEFTKGTKETISYDPG